MLKIPLLRQIAIQCLQMEAITRPTAAYICLQLEGYINQLEQEHPMLSQQYKQDKHSLWLSIQSQEIQLAERYKIIKAQRNDYGDLTAKKDEYISSLELQLEDSKNKVQELEVTAISIEQKKGKELAEKDEINKQLMRTYQTKLDSLREEVKMKQEEVGAAHQKCAELQKVIEDLQLNLEQEGKKKIDLQSNVPTNGEGSKQEEARTMTDKEEETEHRMSTLELELVESKEQLGRIQQEKESLQKMLSEQDVEIKQLIVDHQRESTDSRRRLEEIQQNHMLEKNSLQKTLDEQVLQLTRNQTEADELREDLKVKEDELNAANLKIQKLWTKSKAQKASIEDFQRQKQFSDLSAHLQQNLLEVDGARREELASYVQTFRGQDALLSKLKAELTNLTKSYLIQKQHLEDKSYRMSILESSYNELQQSSESREQKIKSLEQTNSNLTQLLDNNDRIQRNFENDLKSKEESLKRKEEELKLQKKEHADALSNLQEQHKREVTDLNEDIKMYKSQADGQEEVIDLLKKEAQIRKYNSEKTIQDKLKATENELCTVNKAQRHLKRQLKQLEIDVKEKKKHIESLTKNATNLYPNQYSYNVHWYPSMSLPVKRIRPSVTIMKGKTFMTSGYQFNAPQDEEMDVYLQSLKNTNAVFSYDPEKCQCTMITSPVQLGALASVNGQCVLVSGANSVGNTLTGNVYVLCEEGSHDQWKEFSKPLPTPRILACACCYGNRWLIVCGGFACRPKEESSLLEAVSVVEILDANKDEWYTLSEESCPNFTTILSCSVVGEEVYVVGSDQVIKTSCNKLIKAATSNNALVWDNVEIETEESNGKLYPFSVVEVNGEPMIIASMSDGENDVTCVLMKDIRGRWRIMSKAVECQHCSAAVMISSLELLLFGGSEKILVNEGTDISQKGAVIPTLSMWEGASTEKVHVTKTLTLTSIQTQTDNDSSDCVPVTVNQPADISFTGPIHTAQFDHNGGAFQSPIHKVSLVVPPNALGDGEKVTVYMGATTSGPFDLPEDCKLRSAVVWLSVSPSDVVFKRSVSVIVPHSAVFTSPQHHSMMRFVTCGDHAGPRYKFSYSLNQYKVDERQGLIELSKFVIMAVVACSEFANDHNNEQAAEHFDCDGGSQDVKSPNTSDGVTANGIDFHQKNSFVKGLKLPPPCYLAKLFWPHGELPSSFRVDVYYIQKLPTLLYKINTLYKEQYHKEYGAYPEIVETEFIPHTDKVKCVLPCYGSSECVCLTGWDVTQMTDKNEIQTDKDTRQPTIDPINFSVKFNCCNSGAPLTCIFKFQGAVQLVESGPVDLIPPCLRQDYCSTDNVTPFIIEKGVCYSETEVTTNEPKERVVDEDVHNTNSEMTDNREDS